MDNPVKVRRARVEDAAEMARVNVLSWHETYRGVMADSVLDDPELPTTGKGSGPPRSAMSATAPTAWRWPSATAA